MKDEAADGEEEEEMEFDEEMLKAELRRREELKREAYMLHEYRTKIKENTLQTFTDKPDPVNRITLVNSTPFSLAFEWQEPASNNSEITGYTVLLDGEKVANGEPDTYFECHDLKVNTIYRVQVIAESAQGEGYKGEPVLFKTSEFSQLSSLYVWGKNASSEIGLTDEMCEKNAQHYRKDKSIMYSPVEHPNFSQMCAQAVGGNINSTFLCVDENDRAFVISTGVTAITKEGLPEIKENEIRVDKAD
jgi:hypothetical protein